MNNLSNHILGVDVGGTHLKIGLVNKEGEILSFDKEDTRSLRNDSKGFNTRFLEVIGKYLKKYEGVKKIGIGLPGLVNKQRTTTLEIPAISELNGFDLKNGLLSRYPDIEIFLENDACAAAIGEYHFGLKKPGASFLFITLGTGIGSAFILDGKIFKGARGNAMEMGHVLSRSNKRLEELIGRNGILNIIKKKIDLRPDQAGELLDQELGIHLLVRSAKINNPVSLMVFEEVGEILGEALVSTIRILDVNEVYFGGGVSAGLEFMLPSIEKTIRKYLTGYYLRDLQLKRATLENNAGTLGAAALCFTD